MTGLAASTTTTARLCHLTGRVHWQWLFYYPTDYEDAGRVMKRIVRAQGKPCEQAQPLSAGPWPR